MTASYNESRLDDVIFVISVNVKSFEENENFSFIKNMNDNNDSNIRGENSLGEDYENNTDKGFIKEKLRIVKYLSDKKSIALLEYNCCSVNISSNKSFVNGSNGESSHYVHSNSTNGTSNAIKIFEDIT